MERAYIKQLKKQKMTDKQIIDFLVAQGYDSKVVTKELFWYTVIDTLPLIGIMIILAGIAIAINITNVNQKINNITDSSDDINIAELKNPKNWVQDNDPESAIDIPKATGYQAKYSINSLQVKYKEISTAFDYDGYYHGNYFSPFYSINNTKIIEITPKLIPNDNISQIYVVLYFNESDDIVGKVFVDNDYLNNFPEVNIAYGAYLQYFRPLEFSKIENGISYATFSDDKSRYSENFKYAKGYIIIGNIIANQVLTRNFDKSVIVVVK